MITIIFYFTKKDDNGMNMIEIKMINNEDDNNMQMNMDMNDNDMGMNMK